MADSLEQDSTTDIDAGVAEIAEGLFDSGEQDDDRQIDGGDTPSDETPTPETADGEQQPSDKQQDDAPAPRAPPQSWAKDKHEIWAKLPAEAQDYYEQREKQMLDGLEQYKEHSQFGKNLKEVFTPYKAMLAAQGVDEVKATQYLLNAHYRLSNSAMPERTNYFIGLAKSYGIDLGALQQQQDQQPQADPVVKSLQAKVDSLEQTLTQQQQREVESVRSKITAELDAFAKDPKNIYFEECADDIVALLQAGNTLEAAYEKAVYANPVTRAKEIARLQTEHEKTLRANAEKAALAARGARSTNVRGRDTRRTPTEPLGTMDDTLASTLKEIKERVH